MGRPKKVETAVEPVETTKVETTKPIEETTPTVQFTHNVIHDGVEYNAGTVHTVDPQLADFFVTSNLATYELHS